jgi:hypothetical protein
MIPCTKGNYHEICAVDLCQSEESGELILATVFADAEPEEPQYFAGATAGGGIFVAAPVQAPVFN